MSHVTFRMSHVICQMLMLIHGTCWKTFIFVFFWEFWDFGGNFSLHFVRGSCSLHFGLKQGKCNCFGEDNFLSCQFINNHGILWTTTITQSDVLRSILHSSRELVSAALTALFSSDWHLIFPSCCIYLLLLRIAPRQWWLCCSNRLVDDFCIGIL